MVLALTSRHCAAVMHTRVRRVSEPVARSVRQIFFSSCGSSGGACRGAAEAACSAGADSSAGGAAMAPVAAEQQCGCENSDLHLVQSRMLLSHRLNRYPRKEKPGKRVVDTK